MARLPKGVQPTPHKIRQEGYRKALKERGGRRLNTDLEADGAAALLAIETFTGKSAKDCVTAALIAYAASLPGKPPAS